MVLNRPVSRKSSSFHGELDAISLALSYCDEFCSSMDDRYDTVHIFTDCKAALQTVINGSMSNYVSLVIAIHQAIRSLLDKGVSTELSWIPGHADLKPNELADSAAKDAARQASGWNNMQDNSTLSFSEIKKEIRINSIRTWQRRWDRQEEARHTFSIIPKVSLNRDLFGVNRKFETTINRLVSGHSLLEEHASRMKIPSCPTPLCSCGTDTGTVEHYLLHCPQHTDQRHKLIATMERFYQRENVKFHLRSFDVPTLLGNNTELPANVRRHIVLSLATFLQDTSKPL